MLCRFASIFLVACCSIVEGFASDAQEPVAQVRFDDAWLVARINVDQFQVPAFYGMLDRLAVPPQLPSQQASERFVTEVRQAGGEEIYFVRSGSTNFLCVPAAPGANAAAIQTALVEETPGRFLTIETAARLDNAVFAGARSILQHLREQKQAPAARLNRALAATSDFALQVVLLPDDDKRRFAERFVWDLFRSGPAQTATSQIEWASIGFDCPPEARLAIVLEAKDAAAADRLETSVKAFLEPLVTHAAVRTNVALVENLRRILTPRRSGNRPRSNWTTTTAS